MKTIATLFLGLGLLGATAATLAAQDTARARVPAQLRPLRPGVLRPAPTPAPPAPTITGLKPVGVRTTGGNTVVITGTGFVAGATVTVGGVPAAGLDVDSATRIRITTPAGPAGAKDVVVTTSGGSATSPAASPTIRTSVPASGSTRRRSVVARARSASGGRSGSRRAPPRRS